MMEFTCSKDDYLDVLQNYNGEITIKLTGEFEDFYEFIDDVNDYCYSDRQITLDLSEAEANDYIIPECSQIVSVIFPKDLQGKTWSVHYCENLTSVELPFYASDIKGYNPFSACPKLDHIYIPNNVYFDPYYNDNGGANSCFQNINDVLIEENNQNYTIIDNIFLVDKRKNALVRVLSTELPAKSFSLTIPESITYIAPYAFKDIKNLIKLELHPKITGFAIAAFSKAEDLKEICNMPAVTEFPNNCFEYCQNLSKVEFPSSVKYIGKDCFGSCSNLKKINIPEGVECLDSYAFRSSGLEKVIIPKTVKRIGTSCFIHTPNLKFFQILSNACEMDHFVLEGCPSLKEVHLPLNMLSNQEIIYTFVSCPDDPLQPNMKVIFE